MYLVVQILDLQELVDNYSQRFPMQIKVINGFSGQTTQLTLSSGDYYNIHFMKHQEVISLKDKIGFTYTIPLNSSLCFGLVHSGRANQLRDLDTHVYKRVSDLLALSPLPKVVCATKDVKGSDEKCIVTADEILVIRNVLKPKLRKRSLEVLSLKTQTTKILPSDCEGHFTLSPKRNQIYLLELVKCIPDPFPCQAMMFVTDKLSSKLQCITPTLLSTVFTVTGHKTETSLIASAVTRAENGTKDAGRAHIQETLVDIPVDERLADVEVAIIETKNSQQENLNDTTRALFENFDATRVTSWYDGSSDNVHITQHLLYSSIKRDSKGPSIHVDKPLGAYSKESPSLTFNETHTNVGRESLYESLSFTSETDSQCCSPLLFQPFTSMPLESKVPDQKFSSHNSQSPSHNFDHFSCDRAEALYELPISRKNLMEPPTVVNLKRSHSHPASFTNLEPDYEDMQSVKKQYASIKLSLNSGRQEEFQVENTSTTALIDSLKASIADLATQVSGIEHQVREIVQISTVIQKNVSILTTQISKLQGSTAQCAPDIVVENEAQHYLQQLDTHQVLMGK